MIRSGSPMTLTAKVIQKLTGISLTFIVITFMLFLKYNENRSLIASTERIIFPSLNDLDIGTNQ